MRNESRARVEEHADDHGQHGVRQYVDVQEVVRHHRRRHDTINHNQREKKRKTRFAVVVILAEKVEVEHEAEHKDADVYQLAYPHQTLLSDALATFLRLLLQTLQNIVSLRVYNFPTVDNFLPGEDDAFRPRVIFQHLLLGALRNGVGCWGDNARCHSPKATDRPA